jgi:hypothetical protein
LITRQQQRSPRAKGRKARLAGTGYTVRDKSNHVYKFDTFSLGAGKSVRIHTGTGTNTSTGRNWNSAHTSGTTPGTRRTCVTAPSCCATAASGEAADPDTSTADPSTRRVLVDE